ncbi:MAG: FHA domain-containing protein [Nannocystaceae bacterium]
MELELTPPPDSGLWATRQAAEPDSVTAEWSPTPPTHHSSITFVPPDDNENSARPQTPVGGLPVGSGRDSVHIPQKIVASGQRSKGAAEIHLVLVQRDGSDGESFLASGRRLTIGRREGDVRFPEDEFLSPNHARVECSERSVRVVDLESHNGVYLRITGSEPVYPGDVFLLGHQLLRLDNVPDSGRERPPAHGVRSFGTPLHPAWGRLVLIGYGGCEAETYFLRPQEVIFGRELGDIVFPTDAFISRRHARLGMELVGEEMTVVLEDLQSANGTYLRMRGYADLSHGDMFRVGDQIFRVRVV